jgi:site-specific DNA-methyltransferase (adenine-specific)
MDKIKPYFKTEYGKLYEGDCIDLMKNIPDNTVDCFFADPPFNLKKDYDSKFDDNLEDKEYLEWTYKWLDEGIRTLAEGGSFFVYNLPKWNVYIANHLNKNLNFKHWITIDIKFSLPIKGKLYPSHYSLLYYTKGKKAKSFNPPRIPIQTCRHCGKEIKDYGGYKNKLNPKGINLSDVWTDIPPVRHVKYKNRSSNELSLKLMDRILDIATQEDDLVLDPFGGSGTTYIAAELKKRHWIGIEKYTYDAVVDRFKSVSEDREYLDEIRKDINVLFTRSALKLREKNNVSNLKFNI